MSAIRQNNNCDNDTADPGHIAIIMDGNGRWASKRGLPRTAGHRSGVEAVRRTVSAMIELGIPYLTLYTFSSENWSRPKTEIIDLMGLLKFFIRRDLADLHARNVRIRVIGELEGVESELAALIRDAVITSQNNTGLQLTVAFNYGARDEIAGAVRRLAEKVKSGEIEPSEISKDVLATYLDTSQLPDPDLLIRTSGEKRLSNFLLWQCAYTEFVFQDVHWPDYNKDYLCAAIDEYRGRNRRFGGVKVETMV